MTVQPTTRRKPPTAGNAGCRPAVILFSSASFQPVGTARRELSQSPQSPPASPLRDRAQPFQGHQPAAGHRAPGLRPGRPDAGARSRAGPDPRAARQGLSRRRAGAPLPAPGDRRGLLHQLRFPSSTESGLCCIRAGRRGVGCPDAGARRKSWPSCASTVAPTPGTCRRISTMAASSVGRRPGCQRASARGPALPRAAARGAAPGRHPDLRGDRAPAAGRQPEVRLARAGTGGHGGTALRAAACGQPGLPVPPAARGSAAPGRRDAAGPGARQIPLFPCRGRRPAVVLAGEGVSRGRSTPGRRPAALPRALRPRGLGPGALPVFWGWEYKFERTCRPTSAAGPLRDARAVGRAGGGLGQSEGGRWPAAARVRFRRSAAARRRLSAGAGRGVAADAGVSGLERRRSISSCLCLPSRCSRWCHRSTLRT